MSSAIPIDAASRRYQLVFVSGPTCGPALASAPVFLGVLQRAEERIGQRDNLNVAGFRILADRRIDPEAQREIHRLASLPASAG